MTKRTFWEFERRDENTLRSPATPHVSNSQLEHTGMYTGSLIESISAFVFVCLNVLRIGGRAQRQINTLYTLTKLGVVQRSRIRHMNIFSVSCMPGLIRIPENVGCNMRIHTKRECVYTHIFYHVHEPYTHTYIQHRKIERLALQKQQMQVINESHVHLLVSCMYTTTCR